MPQTPEETPAGGASGSNLGLQAAARTGRIVHQDTIVRPIVPRRQLVSYATIDQTPYQQMSSETERSPSIERTVRKRPPLQHAACFDQSDLEFNGRSKSVVQFRSRSASLERRNGDHDDTPETPSFGKSEESEDRATVRSGISFDLEAPLYPEFFVKKHSEMETVSEFESFDDKIEALYEGNSKKSDYFYDRAGPSSTEDDYYRTDDTFYNTSADINDPLQIQRMSVTALFEKFCADEREIYRPQPVRQASETCFRTNRLKGISSDRLGIFVKKNRTDRMSTSSLGDQPGSGSCFSIFEKRKGKLGRLEKSKRLSTSALYDQSPTSNQINKPSRIRSTEERLFKNNSDEFSAKNDQFYDQLNAPSTSKSENFGSKFRFDENPLERASVAKLYEKFCNDDKTKSSSIDTTQSTPGHIPEERSDTSNSSKPELYSAASLSEKTSDIMSSTIKTNSENIFNFNVPELDNDKSEACASEEISNTIQLLFEDPRSNRTSVSDIYEPCFSICLTPRQPSFKRESIKGNWMDVTSLELRAIDDESPTASKFTSVSSPNTDVENSDVFITPDYQFSFSINGDTLPTLADIHEGDSTEENSFSDSSGAKHDKLKPSKSMSSRSSMQKLQPIVLNKENGEDNKVDETENIPMEKLSLKNNCAELIDGKTKYQMFRIRKVKQIDGSTAKRTRCFPL